MWSLSAQGKRDPCDYRHVSKLQDTPWARPAAMPPSSSAHTLLISGETLQRSPVYVFPIHSLACASPRRRIGQGGNPVPHGDEEFRCRSFSPASAGNSSPRSTSTRGTSSVVT